MIFLSLLELNIYVQKYTQLLILHLLYMYVCLHVNVCVYICMHIYIYTCLSISGIKKLLLGEWSRMTNIRSVSILITIYIKSLKNFLLNSLCRYKKCHRSNMSHLRGQPVVPEVSWRSQLQVLSALQQGEQDQKFFNVVCISVWMFYSPLPPS